MKFFDLFAGIGGFRVGLEAHGHECVGSCEIDVYARKVYAKNFGHEPRYRDVRDINPKDLPDFDIMCGGFPCQSFSLAGNRKGFEDTRGTLFFEIARLVKEKRPSILLLENVKGLLSHEEGKTFGIIIQTLDELGYDVEWQLLNSKYFVPQNRERIFIIGHLRGSGSRKILPIGNFRKRNAKSREETQTERKRIRMPYTRTIDANYWKGGSHGSMIAEPKIKLLQNSSEDTYRIYSVDGIARTLRSSSGGLGSKTGVYAEPKDKKVQMNYKANTNANMKERVQDRDETWTLTGNSNDFTITQNHRVRRLTPIECERLQGFKDNWTKGVSDTQRYKMLGNAVTTNVIEYIGRYLK